MIDKSIIIQKIESMDPIKLADIFCASLRKADIAYTIKPDGFITFNSLFSGKESSQLFIDFTFRSSKSSPSGYEKDQSHKNVNMSKCEIPFSLNVKDGCLNYYRTTDLLLTA